MVIVLQFTVRFTTPNIKTGLLVIPTNEFLLHINY